MPKQDTIRLGFNFSLVVNNLPPALKLDNLSNKENLTKRAQAIESFGFFDTSSPNYATYYPDATEEDLKPKDSEFIYPVFRALSEVVVHKRYNPVSFARPGVLKNSAKLLVGQTILIDHEVVTGNSLGAVLEVFWEEGYKSKEGFDIPAGINSRLKIDGKSNPRISRQILMEPPGINSVSVTVQFLWEKSHPEMTDEEFWSSLGGYDANGKFICREVVEILRYTEISLVPHGADPYAQLIKDNGEINNPLFANQTYERLSEKTLMSQKQFVFDYKLDLLQNSDTPPVITTPHIPINIENEQQKQVKMKELLLKFATTLGLTAENQDTITEEAVMAALAEKLKPTPPLVTAEELTRLKAVESEHTANADKLKNIEALSKFKSDATETLKNAVVECYNLSCGNKPNSAILDMIKNSSYEALTALKLQYETQLDESMPISCQECGSKKVTRATAKATKEGTEHNADEAMDALLKSKGNGFLVNREK